MLSSSIFLPWRGPGGRKSNLGKTVAPCNILKQLEKIKEIFLLTVIWFRPWKLMPKKSLVKLIQSFVLKAGWYQQPGSNGYIFPLHHVLVWWGCGDNSWGAVYQIFKENFLQIMIFCRIDWKICRICAGGCSTLKPGGEADCRQNSWQWRLYPIILFESQLILGAHNLSAKCDSEQAAYQEH